MIITPSLFRRRIGILASILFLCSPPWASAQVFQITDVTTTSEVLEVGFPSAIDSYFILNRGHEVGNITSAVDMVLGQAGEGQLTNSMSVSGSAFYNVLMIPLLEPGDADGDEIDDVYELQHSNVLNPLNPLDASLDFDIDGVTNLREYERGTDLENQAGVNITLYVNSLLGLDILNGLTPTPGASPVGPKQTIQGAVSAGVDGDKISIAAGRYGDIQLVPGTKNITLSPQGDVIISSRITEANE